MWALTLALHQEVAVEQVLHAGGGRGYLASLLAQPVSCVRDDLLSQVISSIPNTLHTSP